MHSVTYLLDVTSRKVFCTFTTAVLYRSTIAVGRARLRRVRSENRIPIPPCYEIIATALGTGCMSLLRCLVDSAFYPSWTAKCVSGFGLNKVAMVGMYTNSLQVDLRPHSVGLVQRSMAAQR